MPAAHQYDLIVLYTAPAGEKVPAKAAYFCKKVVKIEKEQCYGGAGVNTGTLPSKTLKESAQFYSGEYDTSIHSNDRLLDGNTTI